MGERLGLLDGQNVLSVTKVVCQQFLTEHPAQFKLGNLKKFGRLMGHIYIYIKKDCENFFNQKKTHAIYHSNPLFRVCHISLLLFIYIEVWSGLEAF